MKSRSARLHTLVQLAALAEREARQRLGQANAELRRREAQQSQLESYVAEYGSRWLSAGQAGIEGHVLVRFAAFRTSLDATLEVQQGTVRQAREGGLQATRQWHGTRNRLKVFDELAARVRRDERHAATRRDQLQNDELASGRERGGFLPEG